MNLKERLYFFPKTFFNVLIDYGVKDSMRFLSDYHAIRKEIKTKLADTISQYKIDNPGIAYQKYLDVDFWVYESLRRAYRLGLHKKTAKKRILDLGTGTGYFPFICNYYGHHAEALDVPDNKLYNLVIHNLGITRFTQYIHPFKDLEGPGRYDLITAFMICFNNHKTPQLWHIGEWDFFMKSLAKNNLNQGGEVYLSFNSENDEEPVSKELLNYFKNHQAKVSAFEVAASREYFITDKIHIPKPASFGEILVKH